MKCEYCNKEIPAGTEVESNGRYFCNALHKYHWEQQHTNFSKNSISSSIEGPNFSSSNNSNNDFPSNPNLFDASKPMALGDIFSVSFDLIKSTFLRNLIVAAAIIIPAGILMAYGFQIYFNTLLGHLHNSSVATVSSSHSPDLYKLYSGIAIYILTLTIFMLAYLGVMIGVTKIGCSEMEGEKISAGNAFKKIFSITYLKAIGIGIVFTFALTVLLGISILVLVIGSMTNVSALKISGGLLIAASIIVMIYLVIKWYFTFIVMVNTDEGVFKSFSVSSSLVKNNWWRVFGILILVSLVINFAGSLIMTPISFGLMWGYISQMFKGLMEGNATGMQPENSLKMLSSSGFSLGLVMVLNTLFQLLLIPMFHVVLYFDLKIRKKIRGEANQY